MFELEIFKVDRTQTQEKIQDRDILRDTVLYVNTNGGHMVLTGASSGACWLEGSLMGLWLSGEGGRGAHEGVYEVGVLLSGRMGSS